MQADRHALTVRHTNIDTHRLTQIHAYPDLSNYLLPLRRDQTFFLLHVPLLVRLSVYIFAFTENTKEKQADRHSDRQTDRRMSEGLG